MSINAKKFQRTRENFICENCGKEIIGNGYTNHCPQCLWSKHVDLNPGDRICGCKGMMRPARIELKNGEYYIIHKCVKCGLEKKNKKAEEDNFKEIIKIN
jgi:rubrerythrin